MAATRIEPVDWKSSPSRVALLGFGWTLAVGALATIVAGAIVGVPALFVAGALAGFAAWAVAKLIPDPVPVAPTRVRSSRSIERRFSSHRLPR